jgi:MFS family permease
MALQPTKQNKFSREQKAICGVVIMITFISAIFGSSMNLLVPTIGKEFNVSAGMVGWIMTSFTVTVAVLSIPAGRLADIIGKRRIFVPGVVIFSIFSLMPVFAYNLQCY